MSGVIRNPACFAWPGAAESMGVHMDLPESVYHGAMPLLSQSGMKVLARSPAHFADMDPAATRKETPAMMLGTAFHAAVLQPDRFGSMYAVDPKMPKRSNEEKAAWRDWQAERPRMRLLDQDDMNMVMAWREAVMGHAGARTLIESALSERTTEVTIVWTCPETGVVLKARLDAFTEEFNAIIDLKTALTVEPDAYAKAAYDLGYHVQAAHYRSAALDSLLNAPPDVDFTQIAVEKSSPHIVVNYSIRGAPLEAGEAETLRMKRVYAKCMETGNWPGYGDGSGWMDLNLPGFARKDIERKENA